MCYPQQEYDVGAMSFLVISIWMVLLWHGVMCPLGQLKESFISLFCYPSVFRCFICARTIVKIYLQCLYVRHVVSQLTCEE